MNPVSNSSIPSRASSWSTSASAAVTSLPWLAARASTRWMVVSCACRLAQNSRGAGAERRNTNAVRSLGALASTVPSVGRPVGEPVQQFVVRRGGHDPGEFVVRQVARVGRRHDLGGPAVHPADMRDQIANLPARAGRHRRRQAGGGGRGDEVGRCGRQRLEVVGKGQLGCHGPSLTAAVPIDSSGP